MKEKLGEEGGKPVRKDVLNFVPTEADIGRDLKDVVTALEKIADNAEKLRD